MKTKITIQKLLVATLCSVLFFSCEKEKKVIVEKLVPANESQKIEVNDQMSSEELALAAEQLITPNSFMYADIVLDKALQKDPNNFRALFYKKLLAMPMLLKGARARTEGFIKIDNYPTDVALRKFFNDGKKDIYNLKDLQSEIVKFRKAANDLRQFVKSNINVNDFVIHLNPDTLRFDEAFDYRRHCWLEESNDNSSVYVCDTENIYKIKLNAGDMTALSQIFAGQFLYFTLATAYSVEGIERLFEVMENNVLTEKQIIELAKSIPTLGKLKEDHALSDIKSLGVDAIAAFKWVKENASSLCPKGPGQFNQRRGFLFPEGLCVERSAEADNNLKLAENLLAGTTLVVMKDRNCNQKYVRVNATSLFTNPVADLRQLAPVEYNQHDRPSKLADPTYGGTFVDGDADEYVFTKCGREGGSSGSYQYSSSVRN